MKRPLLWIVYVGLFWWFRRQWLKSGQDYHTLVEIDTHMCSARVWGVDVDHLTCLEEQQLKRFKCLARTHTRENRTKIIFPLSRHCLWTLGFIHYRELGIPKVSFLVSGLYCPWSVLLNLSEPAQILLLNFLIVFKILFFFYKNKWRTTTTDFVIFN